MIDLLLTADPSDNLSLWFSYNYNWYEDTDEAIGFASSDLFVSGDDPELHSFGLAGRLAVTDTTGVAVRGELIVYDLDNSELDDDPLDADDEFVQWSLTATIDHALTDNLVAKFETRWDAAEERIFLNQNGNAKRNQLIAIAQLAYTF